MSLVRLKVERRYTGVMGFESGSFALHDVGMAQSFSRVTVLFNKLIAELSNYT